MQILDLDNPKNLNNYSQAIEIFPPGYLMDMSNIAVKSMQEAFRAISESALLSIAESFSIVNKKIGQMLAAQLAAAKLMDTFKNYYSPVIIIDSEPEAVLALPLPKISNKTRLGIFMTSIRTFKYKRQTLSKLSMKNAEGKILSLFMNANLFASDLDIKKTINVKDNREFSWVIRNLKNKFKSNNLILNLERIWNPDGYTIRSIITLQ